MLRAFFWVTLIAAILLFGQTFAGVLSTEAVTDSDLGHTMVLFLHQLLLVYWLGPDIAIFAWSRLAVNDELDVEQRIVAGKMMTQIDIVPRVCLSLFLTVAGILSNTYGMAHPWWQMAGIILLGPFWLTIVLLSYLNRGSNFGDQITRFDLWLRGLLVVAIPVSVAWSFSTGRFADSPWIAGKLMVLAAIILLGLIMRLRLRAFFAGLAKLETEGQSEMGDTRMERSLMRARPFVYSIWVLLMWAALMGVFKPGEREPAQSAAMVEPGAMPTGIIR